MSGQYKMEKVKKEIIKEAERIRIDCVYKANAHFKIAAFWSKLKFLLGIPITILAAITSGLALSSYHEVAGYFALIVSILSAITTFLEPTEKQNSHFNSSNSYTTLVSNINIFCKVDCAIETSKSLLLNRLKEYEIKRDELNQISPFIPFWAQKKAEKCVKDVKKHVYEINLEETDMQTLKDEGKE